ncbi:MAG: hypothetical protein P8Y53_23975, partial [Pseudolabrys sp.]
DEPHHAVMEAPFAVGRFQIEDASFHPYSSKFDYWLEGKARFTSREMRGYRLFNDPQKANCAGCHVDRVGREGLPPLFTDHQYEALGVPRNPKLTANRDPAYFDLGLCGPYRADMARQTQYCGMFATPTLRNVATRRVFFHNGVYHSLREVLDFYAFRDTEPEKIYPRAADGTVNKFDDLPPRYRGNIDALDAPFDRHAGAPPALTAQDKADIIAFLETLRRLCAARRAFAQRPLAARVLLVVKIFIPLSYVVTGTLFHEAAAGRATSCCFRRSLFPRSGRD